MSRQHLGLSSKAAAGWEPTGARSLAAAISQITQGLAPGSFEVVDEAVRPGA